MRQIKIFAAHAAVAAVFGCALAQAGDIYKYVDASGKMLYTDKPMPGAVLESATAKRPPEVSQRDTAAAQATTNSQLNASNQRIADAQGNQRAAEAVAKDLETTRLDRCKKAREAYDNSIQARRLYRDSKDGQREYLNDAEIAQSRVDARKQMDAICGPQG
jgi:hypothetical protein